MKLPTEMLVLVVLVTPLLSSCYSYKSLTKKEPITQDFLSQLRVEEKYKFELKTGQTQIIYITSVDAETVTGYHYQNGAKKIDYSTTFENVEKYVAKIAVRKRNPYLTTAAIVGIALPTAAIIWYVTGWK